MLNQDYVVQALQEGGYFDVLIRVAQQAEKDWHDMVAAAPTQMEGATSYDKAVFLNRRIGELLCEALTDDPNVAINTIHRATLITINNEITLRCKKLNRHLRPMNIKTRRVVDTWYRNNRPFPGDFERWINVTFGWKPGPLGMIQGLHIVFEYGDKLEWAFELTDSGSVNSLPVPTPLPTDNGGDQVPYVTAIRDTKRARRAEEIKADTDDQEAN